MKCERCGKNEATFYFKSNINGKITEQHLCADCAGKLGYTERLRPRSLFDDDFFTRPFRLFEPLFEPMNARLLTEFPEPLSEDEKAPVAVREKDLVENEEQEKLYSALRKLPLKYAKIIHLYYFEDMKAKDIADLLHISESAASTRLKRGRDMLKKFMEGEAYE